MDENDSSALSRRRVVGAVGIGMAVSAAAPAFAQNRDQSTSTNRSSEPRCTLRQTRSESVTSFLPSDNIMAAPWGQL
jgi:hypothetical protein